MPARYGNYADCVHAGNPVESACLFLWWFYPKVNHFALASAFDKTPLAERCEGQLAESSQAQQRAFRTPSNADGVLKCRFDTGNKQLLEIESFSDHTNYSRTTYNHSSPFWQEIDKKFANRKSLASTVQSLLSDNCTGQLSELIHIKQVKSHQQSTRLI